MTLKAPAPINNFTRRLNITYAIIRSALSPKDIKAFGEIPSRGISRIIAVKRG